MLRNLFLRLISKNNRDVEVKEIIIATYQIYKSATTTNYIERLLKPLEISISKMEIEAADIFETTTIQ